MKKKITSTFAFAAFGLAILGSPVVAQSSQAPSPDGEKSQTAPSTSQDEAKTFAPASPAASDDLPVLLGATELETERGRATIVLNQQDIEGVVSDNVLGDYAAGDISLSDNALANFSGVGNFLFNTGAQNNLQAGMTLTITIEN